jgi:site-specific recombinase XerD
MMLAGPFLQQYFTNYLIAQRRLSPQTLASYRDTFRLLLQFVQSELKIEPVQLAIEQLDAEIILRFLDNLELQRKNSVVSRNLRLTAIRSFFRMVALHHPECVGTAGLPGLICTSCNHRNWVQGAGYGKEAAHG